MVQGLKGNIGIETTSVFMNKNLSIRLSGTGIETLEKRRQISIHDITGVTRMDLSKSV